MTNALEASHLTIHFDGRDVIRDLSFAVAQGDCLAIIGPNGAGKTVLLKALVGAVPHEGTIHWAAGARVGYVPQKLDIERDLPITAGDLLKAKAHVGRSSRADIGWSLELVNLAPDILNARIGALSGGQFQRLLLAFAFLGKPTVLLFDEPTAGIDEPGEERLYQIKAIMADVHRAERWLGLAGLLALAATLVIGVWRWHRRVGKEQERLDQESTEGHSPTP